MKHSFDVEIAEQYGLHKAILFENIGYWVRKNEQDGRNFYDGRYWTFNSAKAFKEIFPYIKPFAIGQSLRDLEKDGLIISGNYNAWGTNHTKWYTLSDMGECLYHPGDANVEIPTAERRKSNTRMSENLQTNVEKSTIECGFPNEQDIYKQDICKPYTNTNLIMDEFFSRVWSAYPKKKGKGSMSKTKVQMLMKKVGAEQLLRCIDRYLTARQWHKGDEMTYLKDGSTFFNSGYVDYLDENYTEQEAITYADEDKPKRQ